jgi:hypothetical protein
MKEIYISPEEVGFEDIEFVAKEEGTRPSSALVCGTTEEGKKSCSFIEGIHGGYSKKSPRPVFDIIPKTWGVQIRQKQDIPAVDIARTADKDDYMSGDSFDVGY